MTATFSLRLPLPLRYLLETRKPRKSALGRDRQADWRWMGGRRRVKPVLTTHKWMRLATFGHALRPTSLSIAPVLCVPYRTSLFTFAFIQKVPAREFSPRRPPSALSVGWVFRNWHSFVCFHLSARFFVYIPACLTWPAVHCSLFLFLPLAGSSSAPR